MSAYYAVLGIDPGWSGGAALVGANHKVYETLSFSAMTETDIVREVYLLATRASMAYIERVSAFPKQGVVSVFKFGHAYGLVRSAVMVAGISLVEMSPIRWQTALNCRTGGDKNVTKSKAQILFGAGLKITHGIADALLIAEYGVNHEMQMRKAIPPE